jgi:ABC-type Fe3+ transport system substrate-binding protein
MIKRWLILGALVITVALPFLLRPKIRPPAHADDALVIITPHNEAIRHEFEVGFGKWYRARTGRVVAIDWRVVGGSSEITRFLESEYIAAFQNHWTRRLHRAWSIAVQTAFANGRLRVDAPPEAREARATFLASEVSCGIDLFFGGGSYDFIQQANAGRIVPTRVFQTHPEWFTDAVIPSRYAGEEYWDGEGRWVGNVISNYGILYNKDVLARLGVDHPPSQWSDLADPRYVGQLALADPTKSSSIAKAFENLIQQQIQQRLTELKSVAAPTENSASVEARAVREGWLAGLRLLQRLGANARYFTDSSQKPPIDVAQGDCAAGVCIDFYGRSQAEATMHREGGDGRLVFHAPRGGTVNSVDPIAILRGAPHREVAEAFIEYTLTLEGQKLWNFKPGTPGGPERFALRRLPLRIDFYRHDEWKPLRSDPDADPFDSVGALVYQPAWTGPYFSELGFVIHAMCLDPHLELVRAWRAIQVAPEPRRSRALAELQDLDTISYDRVIGEIHRTLASRHQVDEVVLGRDLAAKFRARYLRVERIATGTEP